MILEEKIGRVSQDGLGKAIKLSMEANAVGFRILIKNIYTDEISAIIRELSTNALESHIKAGNLDRPFEVTLPTHGKPSFIIRDYGTGLSPEDIRNVYSVMFRSDKRDSNEMNGCFGIGSKSPYAYSDNFTLESYVDGKKYIYACLIDASGMPNLTPVAGTEGGILTSEDNGVKITIPVRTEHIGAFSAKAKAIYPYFRHKPKINLQIEDIKYVHKGQGWALRQNTYEGNHIKFVMGDVAYKLQSYDKLGNFGSLLQQPIDIFINIGDVSIDSGRERVLMDDKNIAFIKTKLEAVRADAEAEVAKEIGQVDCLWDLRIAAQKLSNSMFKQFANHITWNGTQYYLSDLTSSISLAQYVSGDKSILGWKDGDRIKTARYSWDRWKVLPDKNTVIVQLDKCVASHRRCEYLSSKGKTVYAIKCEDDKFDALIEKLGAKKYSCKASSLERPASNPSNREKFASVVKFRGIGGSTYYSYWDEIADFDIDDGGYYVIIDRGAVVVGERRINPTDFIDVVNAYGQLIGKAISVVGISKKLQEEFEEHDEWTYLCDAFAELAKKEWKGGLADLHEFKSIHSGEIETIQLIHEHIGNLITNTSSAVSQLNKLNKFTAAQQNKYDLINLGHITLFGAAVDEPASKQYKLDIDNLKKEASQFKAKYPLLKHLSLGYLLRHQKSSHADIADYLNK